MKILVSWLREFVDVTASPEDIARTMSVRGFAVEGIEPAGTDDAVLDFEITANRPDAMSVIGMAREVAAAFGLPLAPAARPAAAEGGGARMDVVIENPDLCPRFTACIADVTVRPSPDWMQDRLKAAGVRPISNIVDVTNYVMLEVGQPMHAFDLQKLAGPQIRVRTARAGESLRTLDGQVRPLTADMLVIADAERPNAIAGVMGGAASEVTGGTTAIMFEAAYFNPKSIRRTSKALGLKTEASMRFERGIDPNNAAAAMARACALLQEIGAGSARGPIVDVYPGPRHPGVLALRRHKVRGLLGGVIPDADIERILASLGFALAPADDGWTVTVPTRRVDVLREVDLIEEIARHFGFDQLPVTFPALTAAPPPVDPRITRARQLRAALTAAGFSEAVTFGFIAQPAALTFAQEGELVPIANPLSENFAVLRPSVLPGLIEAVAHNRRRERRDVRLFEVGNCFSRSTGERPVVACAWTGSAEAEHWSGGGRDVDFFDMKGIAERIADALGATVNTAAHEEPWLVRGRSAAIVAGGAHVGVLGQLAPALATRHGIPTGDAVYVAEIDLEAAQAGIAAGTLRVEPLPRYPSVTRDISILIADTLPASTVRETIRRAAPPTLERVREFDRYQGKGVAEGQVSLSLRLTFRAAERTLTDAEVQSAMDEVLRALRENHGAIQR